MNAKASEAQAVFPQPDWTLLTLGHSEGLCHISGEDSGTPMWYWRVHIYNSRVRKLRQEECCKFQLKHTWAKYYKILFQKTTTKFFFKVMTALGLSRQFLEKHLLYMIWPLEVEKEVKIHVHKTYLSTNKYRSFYLALTCTYTMAKSKDDYTE